MLLFVLVYKDLSYVQVILRKSSCDVFFLRIT